MTYTCTIVLLSGRNLVIEDLTERETEYIELWYRNKETSSTLNLSNGVSIRQDRTDTIQIIEES